MIADWQSARLHADAIPVTESMPREREEVLAWVSDEDVAIYHFPVVAWQIDGRWWAGVPGSYIPLTQKRWAVTHWKALGGTDT